VRRSDVNALVQAAVGRLPEVVEDEPAHVRLPWEPPTIRPGDNL
jgi:hypothetical protein